jgi:TolA-binding protein
VLGGIILLLNIPLPSKKQQTTWRLIAKRFGIPASLEPTIPWNPSLKVRRILLVFALLMIFSLMSGGIYRIYTNDPNRWFNEAINLKDAKHFEEARRKFRQVIRESSPVSGISADSAYYVAICYYLEQDNPAAIAAFEDLIAQYPQGPRTPEAYYHIGLCRFSLGQEQQGIDQMRFVGEHYPNSIWAGYAKERLKEHGVFK